MAAPVGGLGNRFPAPGNEPSMTAFLQTAAPAVYVLGALNLDSFTRVASLPRGGETVVATSADLSVGGKGGNQAVGAARAGASVRMIGATGADHEGKQIRQALQAAGVNVDQVVEVEEPTGRANIVVDDAAENVIVVIPGANAAVTEDHVDHALSTMTAGDVLVVQLETPLLVVSRAARIARAKGALTVLNVSPVPADFGSLLQEADVVVVNEHETRQICERLEISGSDIPELISALAAKLSCVIVCTAGAGGVHLSRDGSISHFRAIPVEAHDTTGAGDTFVGYLSADLARVPGSFDDAILLATAASALAVTRAGSMDSIPSRGEAEEFLQSQLTRMELAQ